MDQVVQHCIFIETCIELNIYFTEYTGPKLIPNGEKVIIKQCQQLERKPEASPPLPPLQGMQFVAERFSGSIEHHPAPVPSTSNVPERPIVDELRDEFIQTQNKVRAMSARIHPPEHADSTSLVDFINAQMIHVSSQLNRNVFRNANELKRRIARMLDYADVVHGLDMDLR